MDITRKRVKEKGGRPGGRGVIKKEHSTSTRVAGGMPMVPLQESRLSQSPVWQTGLEVELKSQPVLAQKRPFHVGGAWIRLVCPGGRKKPPSAITGWPALGAAAGHIGKGHLLEM